MIVLGKDKVDERYNIDNNGVITDLSGNIQKTYGKIYKTFKNVPVHRIQMWTKYGWQDARKIDIHHIDGNKFNNNINNLKFLSHSEHHNIHNKINKPMLGKKHSEETKKKIGKAAIGNDYAKGNHFCHTEETKKKISLAHKGKPSLLKGRHLSEETKKKMSEAKKLYWKVKHHKLENEIGFDKE